MSDSRKLHPDTSRADRTAGPAEHAGALTPAETWRPRVAPGMRVVGVAGDEIGRVLEVRADDFLIHRSGSLGMTPAAPTALRFARIHAILGDRITLDVPSSQLDAPESAPPPL